MQSCLLRRTVCLGALVAALFTSAGGCPQASDGPAAQLASGAPILISLAREFTIAPGGSVQLRATVRGGTGGYTYAWSPATGLSDPAIADPLASPASTTTYRLTVRDSGGNSASVTTTVIVQAGSGGDSSADQPPAGDDDRPDDPPAKDPNDPNSPPNPDPNQPDPNTPPANNLPPTAVAGDDQTAYDDDDNNVARVTVNANGSFDPEGPIRFYRWIVDGVVQNSDTSKPQALLALPVGDTTVTLEVEDTLGAKATDTLEVRVLGKLKLTNDLQFPQVAPIIDLNGVPTYGEVAVPLSYTGGDDSVQFVVKEGGVDLPVDNNSVKVGPGRRVLDITATLPAFLDTQTLQITTLIFIAPSPTAAALPETNRCHWNGQNDCTSTQPIAQILVSPGPTEPTPITLTPLEFDEVFREGNALTQAAVNRIWSLQAAPTPLSPVLSLLLRDGASDPLSTGDGPQNLTRRWLINGVVLPGGAQVEALLQTGEHLVRLEGEYLDLAPPNDQTQVTLSAERRLVVSPAPDKLLAFMPLTGTVLLDSVNNPSAQLSADAIGGDGNYAFGWLPPDGLDNTFGPTPIASPAQTTLYTCEVLDSFSAVFSVRQWVVVDGLAPPSP